MSLVEHQLFGTVDKVKNAVDRLREHEPPGGYYLAFSGGKDSQCIYHLAEQAGVKFDSHMNLTTVDPPEVIRFVREHYPAVTTHSPARSMWKLIVDERMPPTRRVRYCCEELKEGGGGGRVVMTGIRWAESPRRKKRTATEQCMRDPSKSFVHPIIEWEDSDVWDYLGGRPHCELYDQGWGRIGCIGCPMVHAEREQQFKRWPRFRRAYARAFQRCVDQRAADGLVTTWVDGEAMFDWWMEENRRPTNDDQMVLFE